MSPTLKPTDYEYLVSPFFADGGELIKRCLQQLCLEKALHIEERWVYVDKRESRKRPRLFFLRGEFFYQYNTRLESERFFLSAFKDEEELSFSQIRWYIKKRFGRDVQNFTNFVSNDLSNQNLCYLRFFPTISARKSRKLIKTKLAFIEKNIDHLLTDLSLLHQELQILGMNIVFLNKETLEKIQSVDKNVENIGLLKFLQESNSFYAMDMLITVGYIGSLDSFDSVDFGGGFDGGGGESGGGGSSGDW